MATCASCGEELIPGAQFCRNCGAATGNEQDASPLENRQRPTTRCPSCGNELTARDLFCPRCGTRNPTYRATPARRKSGRRTALIVAAVLAIVLLIAGGAAAGFFLIGNNDSKAPRKPTAPPHSVYLRKVRPTVRRLQKSSTVLGKALSTVTTPAGRKPLVLVTGTQLTAVQRLRTNLADLSVAPPDQRLHALLLGAAATHRRYLETLVRVMKLPAKGALSQLKTAHSLGKRANGQYRLFFHRARVFPNLVAGSGMNNLVPLHRVLQTKLKQETEPTPPPPPPPSPPPAAFPPANYVGPFAAVDGLEQCYAENEYVACGATPSGKQASLYSGDGAYYDGISSDISGDGPHMPEGTSFTTNSGDITCGSSTRGITCTDHVTGAYFIIGDYYVIVANNGQEARH